MPERLVLILAVGAEAGGAGPFAGNRLGDPSSPLDASQGGFLVLRPLLLTEGAGAEKCAVGGLGSLTSL